MAAKVRVFIQDRDRLIPAPAVAIRRQLAALAAAGLAKGWPPKRVAEVALRAVGQPAEDAELVPRMRVIGTSNAGIWDLVLIPWSDSSAVRAG